MVEKSGERTIGIQLAGALSVSGARPDLTAGGLSLPLPSYDETFTTGVTVARRKLRKLPADLVVDTETRLSDHEPSSLKRLAAMTAWAEEYPGVILQDKELELLNGTTVGRLVSYMQRKRLAVEVGVELNDQELDSLKGRMPGLAEGSENLPPEELRAQNNLNCDRTADMLLTAMDARLA